MSDPNVNPLAFPIVIPTDTCWHHEDDVVIFDRDGSRTRKHQEQPTQGEVCKVCDGSGTEYINTGDGLGEAVDCSRCAVDAKARYFRNAEFGTVWKITEEGAFCPTDEGWDGPCDLGSVDLSAEGFEKDDDWKEITAEEAGCKARAILASLAASEKKPFEMSPIPEWTCPDCKNSLPHDCDCKQQEQPTQGEVKS